MLRADLLKEIKKSHKFLTKFKFRPRFSVRHQLFCFHFHADAFLSGAIPRRARKIEASILFNSNRPRFGVPRALLTQIIFLVHCRGPGGTSFFEFGNSYSGVVALFSVCFVLRRQAGRRRLPQDPQGEPQPCTHTPSHSRSFFIAFPFNNSFWNTLLICLHRFKKKSNFFSLSRSYFIQTYYIIYNIYKKKNKIFDKTHNE